eukprot:XP_012818947.1 PREDICTED: uncharacterized protein LOC105947391 [Xenopus tropicalis]
MEVLGFVKPLKQPAHLMYLGGSDSSHGVQGPQIQAAHPPQPKSSWGKETGRQTAPPPPQHPHSLQALLQMQPGHAGQAEPQQHLLTSLHDLRVQLSNPLSQQAGGAAGEDPDRLPPQADERRPQALGPSLLLRLPNAILRFLGSRTVMTSLRKMAAAPCVPPCLPCVPPCVPRRNQRTQAAEKPRIAPIQLHSRGTTWQKRISAPHPLHTHGQQNGAPRVLMTYPNFLPRSSSVRPKLQCGFWAILMFIGQRDGHPFAVTADSLVSLKVQYVSVGGALGAFCGNRSYRNFFSSKG